MSALERAQAAAASASAVGQLVGMGEAAHAHGVYHAVVRGYRDRDAKRFLQLSRYRKNFVGQAFDLKEYEARTKALAEIDAELESMCEDKARLVAPNLVTTAGKNFLLDSGLAGSAYTAAWYLGLIGSISYTAVAAADTQASHAGWTEAGGANAPTYSGARKSAAWATAASGSKALSAGVVFTFTGSGTVKGCFLTTGSAVDGTTGTLYSAGLFTGGDQPVVATNTLTVSYTASL